MEEIMKIVSILLAGALGISATATARVEEAKNPVEIIKSIKAFHDALNSVNPCMILFSRPSCGPCRTMKPHYEQAAKKHKKNVRFYIVDTSNRIFKPVLDMHNILGLPTLFGCRGGKVLLKETGGLSRSQIEGQISSLRANAHRANAPRAKAPRAKAPRAKAPRAKAQRDKKNQSRGKRKVTTKR